MNGKPTIDELDDLSKGITGCWQSLGRKLRVDEEAIENISENNQYTKPQQKAFEMLKMWHDQGRSSTYGKLAAALREVGEARLAERFEVSNWCSVSYDESPKGYELSDYILLNVSLFSIKGLMVFNDTLSN